MHILSSKRNIIYFCVLFLFHLTSYTRSQGVEYISPERNAEYVSPKTNIIIRPGQILDRASMHTGDVISVYGSSSGTHDGKMLLSDDEKTVLFLPEKDFMPGEVVTVQLRNGLKTMEENVIDPFFFHLKSHRYVHKNKSLYHRSTRSQNAPPESFHHGWVNRAPGRSFGTYRIICLLIILHSP